VKILLYFYRWIKQIWDPIYTLEGISGLRNFFIDYFRYKKLSLEKVTIIDAYPQIHDRTEKSKFDSHYYYVNGWAFRKIIQDKPCLHLDIASQIIFSNLLSASIPTLFLDYRPLHVDLPGLISIGGDITHLPFPDNSIPSISCLHVVEHIGLGRYGDPLNPQGSFMAIDELTRCLAKGGNLYFATPIGYPRVQFNAHRIFNARSIQNRFTGLSLREFSGVDDRGNYYNNVLIDTFDNCNYACGFYWFTKPV
jgi:Caenorhabditis protein of unknown function, DUF268